MWIGQYRGACDRWREGEAGAGGVKSLAQELHYLYSWQWLTVTWATMERVGVFHEAVGVRGFDTRLPGTPVFVDFVNLGQALTSVFISQVEKWQRLACK